MKMIAFVFISIFLFAAVNANAGTLPMQYVRIGLVSSYNNADKISISNDRISAGYESGGVYYESLNIAADSSFYVMTADLYYVRVNQSFNTYAEAKTFSDSFNESGYTAVPCGTGLMSWMVYIGGYATESQASGVSSAISYSSDTVSLKNSGVILMDGQKIVAIFYNPGSFLQIADTGNGLIRLGQRNYRGRIEFSRSGYGITAVNALSMDEYLFGVIPSEMPSSWHIEALKAQAVASRSYAVTRSGVHSGNNYDLCDTDHCQVYLGATNETENSNRAVSETSGKYAYHENEIINAVFFSSSGGATESSENVWNNSLPYLRGVTEINETGAKTWTRTFTLSDINALLKNSGSNIGNAVDMIIGEYSDTGRVKELIIVGSNGTKTLEKESIRTFFSSSRGGSLDSNNFEISNSITEKEYKTVSILSSQTKSEAELRNLYAISENSLPTSLNSQVKINSVGESGSAEYAISSTVSVNAGASDVFTLEGSGFGHGVGMSQYGANGMAQLGYGYEQILKHYYTDIEVR